MKDGIETRLEQVESGVAGARLLLDRADREVAELRRLLAEGTDRGSGQRPPELHEGCEARGGVCDCDGRPCALGEDARAPEPALALDRLWEREGGP